MEIWGMLLTVVSTLGAVWLGHHLSSTNDTKAKTLELRRPAYGGILAALNKAVMQVKVIDDYRDRMGDDAYFNSEVVNKHVAKIGEHVAAASVQLNDSFLILSSVFLDRFQKFEAVYEITEGFSGPDEEHDYFSRELKKARDDLLQIARAELGLDKPKVQSGLAKKDKSSLSKT